MYARATNTRNSGKFCITSIPVPETCRNSVRLPCPYPEPTNPTEHILVIFLITAMKRPFIACERIAHEPRAAALCGVCIPQLRLYSNLACTINQLGKFSITHSLSRRHRSDVLVSTRVTRYSSHIRYTPYISQIDSISTWFPAAPVCRSWLRGISKRLYFLNVNA